MSKEGKVVKANCQEVYYLQPRKVCAVDSKKSLPGTMQQLPSVPVPTHRGGEHQHLGVSEVRQTEPAVRLPKRLLGVAVGVAGPPLGLYVGNLQSLLGVAGPLLGQSTGLMGVA